MTTRLRITATAIAAATFAGPMVAAEDFAAPLFDEFFLVQQAEPESVGIPRDAADRVAEMRLLQQKLAAHRVGQALKQPIVIQLTPTERERIDRTGTVERKYLVGVAKPV